MPASYASDTLARDYADVPYWLAEDYPELFSRPAQLDRCRIYAAAWDVEELLAYPPVGGTPAPSTPGTPTGASSPSSTATPTSTAWTASRRLEHPG